MAHDRLTATKITFLAVLVAVALLGYPAMRSWVSSAVLHNAGQTEVRYCLAWGTQPEDGCRDLDPAHAPRLAPGQRTPTGADADGYWVPAGQVSHDGVVGPRWVKVSGSFAWPVSISNTPIGEGHG